MNIAKKTRVSGTSFRDWKMALRPVTVVLAMLLAGCASTPGVFNNSGLPASDLAVVTTRTVGLLEAEVQAKLVAVHDMAGNQLIGSTSYLGRDRWQTVHLEQGVYRFVAICMLGYSHAYPEAIFEIEKGVSYDYKCVTEFKNNAMGFKVPEKAVLSIEKIVVQ